MRTANVVAPPPGLDQPLRLRQRSEPMDIQTFIPERPVERFDIGIFGRLAWPAEVDPDTMMAGPEIDQSTGEL